MGRPKSFINKNVKIIEHTKNAKKNKGAPYSAGPRDKKRDGVLPAGRQSCADTQQAFLRAIACLEKGKDNDTDIDKDRRQALLACLHNDKD